MSFDFNAEFEEFCRNKVQTNWNDMLSRDSNTNTNDSILQEAERIINGSRRMEYGDANESFGLISELWNVYINAKLTRGVIVRSREHEDIMQAHDVAMMMILMKVARATLGKKKRDNYVDIAGYAALAADL